MKILLDLFHFLQRILSLVPKDHVLFNDFAADFSKALFDILESDLANIMSNVARIATKTPEKKIGGIRAKDISLSNIPFRVLKKRARFQVKRPGAIVFAIRDLLIKYKNKIDPKKQIPLLRKRVVKMIQKQVRDIEDTNI